jgi:hypothetical protein
MEILRDSLMLAGVCVGVPAVAVGFSWAVDHAERKIRSLIKRGE